MTQPPSGDSASIEGRASLKRLAESLRSTIHERLHGVRAADPRDVEEVVVWLLAYAHSLEYLICEVSGRKATIPGHNVSVRGYVDQVLSGETQENSWRRLVDYLEQAQRELIKVATTRDVELDDFANQIAEVFRSDRIEAAVKPSFFQRLVGCSGEAFWEEYRVRFRDLDGARLRELADKERRSGAGTKAEGKRKQ